MEIRFVVEIVEEAKKEENQNVLFHSVNPAYKLIDFIYRDKNGHFHAFQATIGNDHMASEKAIKNLENKVGGGENLTLYYLIPSILFDGFVTGTVEPTAVCEIFHVLVPEP
jgi:hypothetical protein